MCNKNVAELWYCHYVSYLLACRLIYLFEILGTCHICETKNKCTLKQNSKLKLNTLLITFLVLWQCFLKTFPLPSLRPMTKQSRAPQDVHCNIKQGIFPFMVKPFISLNLHFGVIKNFPTPHCTGNDWITLTAISSVTPMWSAESVDHITWGSHEWSWSMEHDIYQYYTAVSMVCCMNGRTQLTNVSCFKSKAARIRIICDVCNSQRL